MEHNPSSEKVRDQTTGIVDDHTVVGTPEHPKSVDETHDVEKAAPSPKSGDLASPEIPDGGLKAWLTVLGAWCIMFATFGMSNAYGVYQDYYVRFFLPAYSPSTIGWIGSTQLFFQFCMGAPAGLLLDAGYFYVMVPFFSLVYALAFYMLSLSHQNEFYQVFLSQGLAAGITMGFLFLPAIGVIAHHFEKRRGLAMGIVVSGSSCGGMVFPVMLNKVIQSSGFAVATRDVAYVCTGMLVAAVLFMRTRLPPGERKRAAQSGTPMPTAKTLLKDTPYVITIVSVWFMILGLFTPIFYLQTYAIVHGIDEELAFYTLTILNGASVIGRIIPNFAADIWGPFNSLSVCTFACIVLQFSMLAATNRGGIIAFSVLYGIFSGASISLFGPLFTTLSNSVSEVGMRLGLAFTFAAFAGLAGTPIAGALLTEELLWVRPICFSGACLVVSLACLLTGRHLMAIRKATWKV